jgi:hypothetical protein
VNSRSFSLRLQYATGMRAKELTFWLNFMPIDFNPPNHSLTVKISTPCTMYAMKSLRAASLRFDSCAPDYIATNRRLWHACYGRLTTLACVYVHANQQDVSYLAEQMAKTTTSTHIIIISILSNYALNATGDTETLLTLLTLPITGAIP